MVERRTGVLGGATGGEEILGPREEGPTPRLTEVEKPFVANRQEEPKEPLEKLMQAPKRHLQVKPESGRPCWKMDQVLKGRGMEDTEVEHSGVSKVGPTDQEAHRRECSRRRCQPKAQRKGSTPAYRHHSCQEAAARLLKVGLKAIKRHPKARDVESILHENPLVVEGDDGSTPSNYW
jgi:hypothetical protein